MERDSTDSRTYAAPDFGAWTWSLNTDLEGCVTYISKSFGAVLGLDQQQCVGKSITKIGLSHSYCSKIIDSLGLIKDGSAIDFADEWNVGNSNRIPVSVSVSPYFTNGSPIGAVILTRSVAPEIAKNQDFHTRMESLARYGDRISHELINLITIVKGNLDLFSELLPVGVEGDRTFQGALHGIQRSEQFIKQINAFSRRGQIQARSVDLNSCLSNIVRNFKRIVPESVTFNYQPAATDCSIYIEEHAFERAIVSLAMSALEAMPNGGALSIRISSMIGKEAKKKGFPLFERDYALIEVCDTGKQMSPDLVEGIFEPSFGSSPPVERLDLSAVYGFSRRSGGVIDASSTPTETVFSLLLPIERRHSQRAPI